MPGTVTRAVQLGLLAKDMACVRLSRQATAVDQARRRLAERMGKLHGLPQKIGQILALGELAAPETPYAPLAEGPATMPSDEAFALIESALRRKRQTCFASIEADGIAASLGQVHRAVLPDGRVVAVKVQYPGIADDLATDLRALGWLTAPIGNLRRGFDLDAYQREVGDMLRRELDYCAEAEALERFGAWGATVPGLEVPALIPELSNERVLTMTWLDGEPFSAVRAWPAELRQQAGTGLLRLFLTSVLRHGELHADPHPGNYRFRRHGNQVRVGLLDFGCVKRLPPALAASLAGMLANAGAGTPTPERAVEWFAALGFNPILLHPMAQLLPAVAAVLVEPFGMPGPVDVRAWRVAERISGILGPYRWNFRVAGPAELVYFVRAFQGLLQYLTHLEIAVDWRAALAEVVADCPAARAAPPTPVDASVLLAQHLRIAVTEHGQSRAEITFGAGATECLAELVPPDVLDKLAARQIDVAQIAQDALARRCAPGELFQLQEGSKLIRVWLE